MYTARIDFDELIREDVPYFDLTGYELGIDSQKAKIAVFTREDCIACGTEEAAEIFRRLRIGVDSMVDSGTSVKAGTELITGSGTASEIVTAWKVVQNLIDHTSGIATAAARFVNAAKSANPDIAVLTTRKMFPGTKALMMKGIMAGGALPHRLGVSETILIFQQHVNLIGGWDKLIEKLPGMKKSSCEKIILVETGDPDMALKLLAAGAGGIQIEKKQPEEVAEMVKTIRAVYPGAVILAAGGINEKNAAAYAATGVDGLVTTSLYTAKPVDIGVRITAG